MKKTVFAIVFMLIPCVPAGAAQWAALPGAFAEPDVRFVAADPGSDSTLYAATAKAVYATSDGGLRWKRVLSLGKGSSEVRFLRAFRGAVYAGSDRGLHRSVDGGRHWTLVFRAAGERPSAPLDAAVDPARPSVVWVAAENGVFKLDVRAGAAARVAAFGRSPAYSALAENGAVFVACADGIRESRDGGETWSAAYASLKAEVQAPAPLEQFDVETMTVAATPFTALAAFGTEGVFAASKDGLLRGKEGRWGVLDGQNFGSGRITSLAPGACALYVATDKGVYRWDRTAFREVSDGLETLDVRCVAYHAPGDYLLAATPNGVYRLSHPELTFDPSPKEFSAPPAEDVLRRFDAEPSVKEVQEVAIRYAEVHPDKIAGWRRAAARKALLPTVSLGADMGTDKNVDVDRGGTADPDRFILGPDEHSTDWSVGMSWDLGDLIWNDDQTSIDTRSRLMVELRDDVLNDVTHLYYERRRLQADMALAPPVDPAVKIEKTLKLEELTARLDALTGGYFSKRLESLSA